MWTPGTAVWIERNGPPVGAPGFGSHVSSWLAPPASQSRITRFCCFFISPARAELASRSMPVMSANAVVPSAAAAVPRNPRREIAWSADPQKCLMFTVFSSNVSRKGAKTPRS
jgi:hypothetical protein